MRPSLRSFITFFALLFCIHAVAAAPHAAVRRQDDSQAEIRSGGDITSARPTVTPSPSGTRLDSAPTPSTTPLSISPSEAPTLSTTSHVSATSTVDQSIPQSTADAAPDNPLPIQPRLNPAMGLTGVVLLISGLVYAIIGIKNKWVYVFGSAAYLTALSVSVLIVYLMSPPVSNAVQGAFFVAAFVTGLIFGALSLVFADITEGFGCLLGGFCLSMWFLSLKEGGLITSTTGRAIFIGCMSAGSYSLYFSQYTRNYGLIASIAFSGATAAILGIDCLASSGWKEFWLYLWSLNDGVFPLNTNSYPLTRNIKAELAGIVIIALFGVISQLRVWKLVQEHRASSAAQQLEKQKDQEREDEAHGRKIEDEVQKERKQWEAAYGNGNGEKNTKASSIRSSTVGPKGSTSIGETELSGSERMEMVDLTKRELTQTTHGDPHAGTTITVGVLSDDDDIRQIDDSGNPVEAQTAHAGPMETKSSEPASAPPPPPVVVPLPFTVPTEDDANSADDNASVSAIPDSDQASAHSTRLMSKRISDMSAMKFRASCDATYSQEDLISGEADDDLASSVAATLDDDNDAISSRPITSPVSPLDAQQPVIPEGPDVSVQQAEDKSAASQAASNRPPKEEGEATDKPALDTVPEVPASQMRAGQSLTTSIKSGPDELSNGGSIRRESRIQADTSSPGTNEDEKDSDSKQAKSVALTQVERAESHVGSLRDGLLTTKLSKVAQSYRTNEWAKHLEVAEKPTLDELETPDSPGIALSKGFPQETPAPVSEELASSLLASSRSSRRILPEENAQETGSQGLIRSGSKFSLNSQKRQRALSQSPAAPSLGNLSRSNSSVHVDVLAPLPSNTLLGKRESLIKNRVSSQSLTPKSSAANLLVDQKEMDNMTLAQRRQILQQQSGISLLQHQTSMTSPRRGPPSASQKWQTKGWSAQSPPVGFDSHQPKRSSSSQSSQKREQLYAGWRDSVRDVTPPQTAVFIVEQQRQVLLNERRQKEMERQQRELQRQQRASQMESMMRSGQMLDAHREAMRKMQADANKRS
ncbi:hypothetical protein IAQ61_011783 [Plenodomus lingam]|uniref:uncharacterized protein n=1 Tax=Leptosphaeria maculans TaxID=5022 RepID=UPI00332B94E2|nr:hypothetical protein IAQ61_011783 [Plenodomus lingam]